MDVNKATIIPYTEDLTILVTGDDFGLEDIETVASFFLPQVHHYVCNGYFGSANECNLMTEEIDDMEIESNMIVLRSRKIKITNEGRDEVLEYYYSVGDENVWEPLIEAKLKELNKEEN